MYSLTMTPFGGLAPRATLRLTANAEPGVAVSGSCLSTVSASVGIVTVVVVLVEVDVLVVFVASAELIRIRKMTPRNKILWSTLVSVID